jgi:hypothetical protein
MALNPTLALGAGAAHSGTASPGSFVALESSLLSALAHVRSNPHDLERKPVDMIAALQAYIGSDGQGTGNKVSEHEACIALVLEEKGFVRAPRGTVPTTDGLWYWYQLQGSQQAGDFFVFEVRDGVKRADRILDAKHSNGVSIYLNDGTFEPGTIYIVSFTRCLDRIKGQRKKPREQVCFVGLGEEVFTEKDRNVMAAWRAALRAMNAAGADTDHLRVYARSANQYSCARFTPEFTASCWEKMSASLGPSA